MVTALFIFWLNPKLMVRLLKLLLGRIPPLSELAIDNRNDPFSLTFDNVRVLVISVPVR